MLTWHPQGHDGRGVGDLGVGLHVRVGDLTPRISPGHGGGLHGSTNLRTCCNVQQHHPNIQYSKLTPMKESKDIKDHSTKSRLIVR